MSLPLEALWLDAAGVGQMISLPAREVRERLAAKPGFPKAVRLGGPRARRRWLASEVHQWLLRQRDRSAQ